MRCGLCALCALCAVLLTLPLPLLCAALCCSFTADSKSVRDHSPIASHSKQEMPSLRAGLAKLRGRPLSTWLPDFGVKLAGSNQSSWSGSCALPLPLPPSAHAQPDDSSQPVSAIPAVRDALLQQTRRPLSSSTSSPFNNLLANMHVEVRIIISAALRFRNSDLCLLRRVQALQHQHQPPFSSNKQI